MLEDNVCLPSNGKLYTKVINWVQRSIWENGDSLEELMEEVSFKVNGIQQFLKIICYNMKDSLSLLFYNHDPKEFKFCYRYP